MIRPFRFAVQGGPFDDPAELRLHATMVESLGYDELYTADHVGVGASDPFIPLMVAAEATTTLRVGPLVLNNGFHQPVLLARTAISVDQMTQGRLVLGLGTGYSQSEHDAIGIPLLPPRNRVVLLEESLEVLRRLLDTGSCSFQGEHHVVAVEELGVRPQQDRIPFLIGGHGRRVVGLAAEHADIFQFTGLTHALDGTPSGGGFALDQVVLRSEWLSEAAGKRDELIERSALVQFTAVGEKMLTQEEMTSRFGLPTEVLADSPFVLSGSVEEIVDKLERLRQEVGISHYVVRHPQGFAPVVEVLRGR